MAILTATNWLPQSESDKETVVRQLELLFAHPTFKNSRRCPAFLQYIVENQLKGETQHLKERIIGAEVFGREPDYDTSADPVVRTTASEVRKRIAQYYQEAGHEGELRIELPLGSYMAEFHLPPRPTVPVPAIAERKPSSAGATSLSTLAATRQDRFLWPAILGLVLVVAVAVLVRWRIHAKDSSLGDFWRPILTSKSPTLVCLNTWDLSHIVQDSKSPFAAGMAQAGMDLSQWLPINDAEAFSRVTAFLGASQSNYHMQGARSTTLSDLMQGPSVLIGVFGNPWTQRITQPLRFYFVRDPDDTYIADRKDPSKRYDVMEGAAGAGERDYAVIGRISNPATGQVSIIVAGLNAAGTTAASEFVTSPRYMDYLESVVPDVSGAKNIEAVISVQVIDGKPGAPHIEAADWW